MFERNGEVRSVVAYRRVAFGLMSITCCAGQTMVMPVWQVMSLALRRNDRRRYFSS